MKKVATSLTEVFIIEPDVFMDPRGFFFESYSFKKFSDLGINEQFVQDNHSRSQRNTVRGLHFQAYPGQVKLIRCTKGRIWDVVVDIRPTSPNFKKWIGNELTDQNFHLIYIPVGFAHGFSVLSEYADVEYKVSNYYDAAIERGFQWNDPEVGVDWKIETPILSKRDVSNPTFAKLLEKHHDPFAL
jgi:dTDP-4-dehydrorhamnose 3,5-epimerase